MFNNIKIKRKIGYIFLFGIVLPITVLMIVFLGQMNKELSRREEVIIQSEVDRIQARFEEILQTMSILATEYSTDKDLNWALETYSPNSTISLNEIRSIDNRILSDQRTHPFIADISLYYENESLFNTVFAHKITDEVKTTNWYQEFQKTTSDFYMSTLKNERTESIIMMKRLNLIRFESQNFLRIELKEKTINELLTSRLSEDSNIKVFLIDEKGDVFPSNQADIYLDYESETYLKNHPRFIGTFESDSLLSGWSIVTISEEKILSDVFIKNIMLLVVTVIVVLMISLLMFYSMAHAIISRLEYMAKVMGQSKDEELVEININMGQDEIGETANHYNYTIRRIQSLMNERIKSRDEINQLLIQKTVANEELQASNEELYASLEEIESQEIKIHDLIYIDQLTGTDNRLAITKYIQDLIGMEGENVRFSIGFLDVDNFKLINDSYGHNIGDEVIRITGNRLKKFEDSKVKIGRFGGDEFIITMLNYKDIRDVIYLHEQIRQVMKEVVVIDNIRFYLTISMGVSLYPYHATTKLELIKLADIALYKAKGQGRDQVVLFELSMNEMVGKKIQKQSDIKNAFTNNQFILHYQPYFDADTNQIKGCEALLRYLPTSGLYLSPRAVIQHVEEMGMMVEFGEWIFIQACMYAKKLNEHRKKTVIVSINISSLQLMQPYFAETILAIMKKYNIEPSYICLEMTETILMKSIDNGTLTINKFRDAGMGISLDDFGTGYSSLKYFKELPVTILKIDKTFIDNIETNEYDRQLVDTMIKLAHNRKIAVIAEGVEDINQINELKLLGCDMIQGYYYSKAISGEKLLEKVDEWEASKS
jgi:diguanylate cyclase (GGDEF)-like protein